MDLGNPASYLVLPDGVPVLGSDGKQVGTVEHVLADDASDVFDGIVIDTPDGHRFADAPLVDAIYERGVVLGVAADAPLPAPEENPAMMGATPDDTTPDDLGDKLRRAWDYLSGRY